MLDPLMKTRLNCLIMSLATLSTLSASAATLVNGANQTGIIFTNTVADSYTFTANTGDSINLRLGTTNFSGELQLYGPNGALLETIGGYPVNDDLIAYMATNSGTFTVRVSSSVIRGTGTYALHLAQIQCVSAGAPYHSAADQHREGA